MSYKTPTTGFGSGRGIGYYTVAGAGLSRESHPLYRGRMGGNGVCQSAQYMGSHSHRVQVAEKMCFPCFFFFCPPTPHT